MTTSTRFSPIAPYADKEIEASARLSMRLESFEVALIAEFGPLAGKSPRALKRMVNLYRLIRVRVPPKALPSFLATGPSTTANFATVLFALACEVGLPQNLADHVVASINDMPRASWIEMVEEIVQVPEKIISDRRHPLLVSLRDAGMLLQFEAAMNALKITVDRGPSQWMLKQAFDVTNQYSFRMTSTIATGIGGVGSHSQGVEPRGRADA